MQLGKQQTLTVIKEVNFGVYLCEEGRENAQVLLPKKQVPEGIRPGDKLNVFIYRDSSDRLIATTKKPYLTLGGFAALKVVSVSKIGAFLDWGLEKDLFLPYKEQLRKVKEGDVILVSLYTDKSNRLCATMSGIYHLLNKNSPYSEGDTVTGRVYEFSENFGTFVAVDDRYSAMIPKYEDTSEMKIGDVITAKVKHVKEDGKLDLTLREKAYIQMNTDAERVLEIIASYGGVLPFNDKASPETIMRETHMSKNAFKRAVGHLYKEHLIEITSSGIRKI